VDFVKMVNEQVKITGETTFLTYHSVLMQDSQRYQLLIIISLTNP